MDGVTINEAVAELPNASDTCTVLLPKVDAGTLKVTPEGKLPELVDVDEAQLTPSKVTFKAELGKKYVPVTELTVTEVPKGPVVGEIEI